MKNLTMSLIVSILSVLILSSGAPAAPGDQPAAKQAAKKAAAEKGRESKNRKDRGKAAAEKAGKLEKTGGNASAAKKETGDGASKPGVRRQFAGGEFVFVQAGTEIGREKFTHRLMSNGTIEASAEVSISTVTTVAVAQRYALDGDSRAMLSYSIDTDAAGQKQRLVCERSGGTVKMTLDNGGTAETKVLEQPGRLFLLDNLNANNYQFVIDSYDLKAGGVQKRTCLVPQKSATIEISIEKAGFVKATMSGKPAEMLKYRLTETARGTIIDAYSDDSGALAAVCVPSQNLVMGRPGFAPEPPAPPKTSAGGRFINGKEVIETEMTFEPSKGVKIFGKLLAPVLEDKTRKVPLALLIAGSGPTDLDGNSKLIGGPVNTLRDIAEHLALYDIASFRYDKRNIGRSSATGDSAFSDYVADAGAALRHVLESKKIEISGIYAIGHSEGGVIALSLAADKKLDGIVLLATPSTPFDKLILNQIKEKLPEMKAISEKDREEFLTELASVLEDLKKGKKPGKTIRSSVPSGAALISGLATQPNFMKGYFNADPVKLAEGVTVPVAAIYAEHDGQVPPSEMEPFKKILAGRKAFFKATVVKGVNHVFKPASGPRDAASYVNPNYKLAPEAFRAITGLILESEKTKKQAPPDKK